MRSGVRGVRRATEEAEQHVPHRCGRLVGGGVELGRQRRQAQRGQRAAEAGVEPGCGAERLERACGVRPGRRVHAEHAGQAAVDQPAGDRLVGGNHQPFDEQVGRVRRGGGHLLGHALDHLDGQLGLHPARFHTTAPEPLHAEACTGGPQPPQHFHDGGVDVLDRRSGEDCGGGLVRQAHVGPDPGGVDVRSGDLAISGDAHLDGEGVAVGVRHQAQGVVAEPVRQHRPGPPGQVDAGRRPAGLRVDQRAGMHVRGDVGDVDAHPDAAVRVGGVHRQRVVEVT